MPEKVVSVNDKVPTLGGKLIKAKNQGGEYNALSVDNGDGTQSLVITDASGYVPLTDAIVVKARNADGYATELDIYGSTIYRNTVYGSGEYANQYNSWYLEKIDLKDKPTKISAGAFTFAGSDTIPLTILGLENVTYFGIGAFNNNGYHGVSDRKPLLLVGIDFSKVTAINSSCFAYTQLSDTDVILRGDCTAPEQWITSAFYKSNIKSIVSDCRIRWNGSNFAYCADLKTAVISNSNGLGASEFAYCTALESVQLGKVGTQVLVSNSNTFNGCTQSGLTITVYCTGANADTQLTRCRGGATNATIIIKASEDTTYNGQSYSAGDVMVTSEVAS